jgi:hypothetical protein
MEGEGTTSKSTAAHWFKRVNGGDLGDKRCSGHPTKFDNEGLQADLDILKNWLLVIAPELFAQPNNQEENGGQIQKVFPKATFDTHKNMTR